jgi:hypothetical protein
MWAILLSTALHAFLVPIALWAFAEKLLFIPASHRESERVVASTAIRLEPRPVPHRQGAPSQPAAPVAPPEQQPSLPQPPQPATVLSVVPTPRPTPKPTPTGSPVPRKQASTPLQQQIAAQQQAFQQEVAQLHKRNDPLSVATVAPQPPAAFHRSAFDVSGNRSLESAQALLFPTEHWIAGSMSCYYTRYAAQFSNGATEEGLVPWPVCYPRNHDRIAEFPYPGVRLPIPYPQPGYVLPPGTYLSQFLRRIYTEDPAAP